MSGLTNAESASTLDVRFPITSGTDYIAWSTDAATEFAGLARLSVGAISVTLT